MVRPLTIALLLCGCAVASSAFYPMQREPDGRWRINGCQLEKVRGRRA